MIDKLVKLSCFMGYLCREYLLSLIALTFPFVLGIYLGLNSTDAKSLFERPDMGVIIILLSVSICLMNIGLDLLADLIGKVAHSLLNKEPPGEQCTATHI